jgi:hypothetical protein
LVFSFSFSFSFSFPLQLFSQRNKKHIDTNLSNSEREGERREQVGQAMGRLIIDL